MQLVSNEAPSKLPRRRVRNRAVAAAAPPCCGTTPSCADRFLSMQTLSPRVRLERAPWHGNCTERSSQLRGSCRTMQPSAGGSGPCPRLRTLPQRFPSLAPPASKRAAATRHSSAPTPDAQRTTRRCPFPVRCRLCRRRELWALGTRLPAWTAIAWAFAAVSRGAPLPAVEAERTAPPPSPPHTHFHIHVPPCRKLSHTAAHAALRSIDARSHTVHISRCALHVACCTFHAACCTVYEAFCTCMLHGAGCILHVAIWLVCYVLLDAMIAAHCA
jgi:hypothetical protein